MQMVVIVMSGYVLAYYVCNSARSGRDKSLRRHRSSGGRPINSSLIVDEQQDGPPPMSNDQLWKSVSLVVNPGTPV